MKACLAAEASELKDPDSPFFRRGRGMTEGTDEHQIHLVNVNTHGMIRQGVSQIQRQTSLKKQSTVKMSNSTASVAAGALGFETSFASEVGIAQ